MASVCFAFGLTPDEYRELTIAEHRAFCDLLAELDKKANR